MEYLAPDYPQKDSRDDSMIMRLGLLDLFAINPAAFFLSFFLSIFLYFFYFKCKPYYWPRS